MSTFNHLSVCPGTGIIIYDLSSSSSSNSLPITDSTGDFVCPICSFSFPSFDSCQSCIDDHFKHYSNYVNLSRYPDGRSLVIVSDSSVDTNSSLLSSDELDHPVDLPTSFHSPDTLPNNVLLRSREMRTLLHKDDHSATRVLLGDVIEDYYTSRSSDLKLTNRIGPLTMNLAKTVLDSLKELNKLSHVEKRASINMSVDGSKKSDLFALQEFFGVKKNRCEATSTPCDFVERKNNTVKDIEVSDKND